MQLKPDAPQLTWQGAVSLQKTEDWVMPWRTPHSAHILFPEPLLERSAMPAGVRISFRSNTTQVSGNIVPQNESGMLDLCCDGELIDSVDLKQQDSFAFKGLSDSEKSIELWLPQFGKFQLRSLEIGDGATLEPFTDTRPRWITYGSSITQCRTAASPTQTWPAIVARTHGLNLTCLGYGGQCHLDAMVARMIRDTPGGLYFYVSRYQHPRRIQFRTAGVPSGNYWCCPDCPRETSRYTHRADVAYLLPTEGRKSKHCRISSQKNA